MHLPNTTTRSQFHQHFMCAFLVQKFVQSQTLSREKLLKRLLYEKCARKMLMKLTLDGRPPFCCLDIYSNLYFLIYLFMSKYTRTHASNANYRFLTVVVKILPRLFTKKCCHINCDKLRWAECLDLQISVDICQYL